MVQATAEGMGPGQDFGARRALGLLGKGGRSGFGFWVLGLGFRVEG